MLTHFNPSQKISPILLVNSLVMVTNEGCLQICSNLACFVHISNILYIVTHEIKPLKFNFYWDHGKMVSNTHLNII